MSTTLTTVSEPAGPPAPAKRTPLQQVHHVLHAHPALSPAIVLVIACIGFGLANERFYAPSNLSLITQQVAVVGALAVGQTLIILTAGIDLSVGAVMVLTSIVMAKVAVDNDVPGPLALLLGLVIGAAAGFVNGMLVTRVRLPPFIVTLGTLNVFTALALLYSDSASVRGSDMPDILTWTGTTFSVGSIRITTGVLLMLALYAFFAYMLGQTAWGKHVYAVGDDPDAARLAGIRVSNVLLSVYVAAGVVFAVAAWILIGRTGTASPNAAAEANLDSITAVVIGGTSLFGGRGAIIGTLLGALIVGVFRNGLALAKVDVLYQTLVVGLLVIAAVTIDQWIRRVRS